jgi:hypothetical protein
VCDLETSKEEAKSPLRGCEYKPTMGCDAESITRNVALKLTAILLGPVSVLVFSM